MLSQSVWSRLSHQLDPAATILAGAPESLIGTPGPDGAWSARDHLHAAWDRLGAARQAESRGSSSRV